MPPPNKFRVVHEMPILNPHLVDPEAENCSLEQYNGLSGSAKSKVLALLAHPCGTIKADHHCPRYTSEVRLPKFQDCVVNTVIFPSGYCTSCAWAGDSQKCTTARMTDGYAGLVARTNASRDRVVNGLRDGT